jgi:hypothetical protein
MTLSLLIRTTAIAVRPMSRMAIQAFATALGVQLLGSAALAEDPRGIHDAPPLSEIKEIVTSVWQGGYNSPYGDQCRIVQRGDGELEALLATSLMQAGFPKASPAEAHRVTPGFIVEVVVRLQNSNPPTCLAGVRAELALGDARRLVLLSSHIVILEAEAGSDLDKPSEDLQKKFRAAMRDLAKQFIISWGGVKGLPPFECVSC